MEGKDKKDAYESANALYEGRESTLNAFKSGILPIKVIKCEALRILTPKQKLQRLAITLAQVETGNTSENLLITYSPYRAKEITKKVHSDITNSVKV